MKKNKMQQQRLPKMILLATVIVFQCFAYGAYAADKPVGCTTSDDCNFNFLKEACRCTGDHCRWNGEQVDGSDFDIDAGPNQFCVATEIGSCDCIQCTSPAQTCTQTTGIPDDINTTSIDGLPIAEFFTSKFLALIPGGGEINSFVDTFLFPLLKPASESTWDQVKDQVEKVVDTAVADQELTLLKDQTAGIATTIADYDGIPDKTSSQAQSKITSIQTVVEAASCTYIEQATNTLSENGPLLLLAQTASTHLAVQFEFLKVMINAGNAENDTYNKSVLYGLIDYYAKLAGSLSTSAVTWRLQQVNSSPATASNINENEGGKYYTAADKLDDDFGLRYYSCYQTQTGGWSGYSVPEYSCWTVCADKPSDITDEANTCLSGYRSDLTQQVTDFWAAHLADFADQWQQLKTQADLVLPGTVAPADWTNICAA